MRFPWISLQKSTNNVCWVCIRCRSACSARACHRCWSACSARACRRCWSACSARAYRRCYAVEEAQVYQSDDRLRFQTHRQKPRASQAFPFVGFRRRLWHMQTWRFCRRQRHKRLTRGCVWHQVHDKGNCTHLLLQYTKHVYKSCN